MGWRALGFAAALAFGFGLPLGPTQALPADIEGALGIRLGTPLAEVLVRMPEARIWQHTKFELSGCYFQYSVPFSLLDQAWESWLCEARDEPVVIALNMELQGAQPRTYSRLLETMIAQYGMPHAVWSDCLNAEGAPTEQYTWWFPSALVRLINRDVQAGWLVVRYDQPTVARDLGPGICPHPPHVLDPP
jgi:hypothetical protein